jgi:ribosomal-protein-alanine N-acetyltransferase
VPETARLILRRWRINDRQPFAVLNADPEVMEYFPSTLTAAESDRLVDRIEAGFDTHGFGLWALELKSSGEMIGFTGLSVPSFESAFTPTVEIGWRMARAAWGHGLATEAAEACLAEGFLERDLVEVVSFTFEGNLRSRAVMERLGMTRNPSEDFDHPNLPVGHRVARHVLYRMPAQRWRAKI